MQAILVNLSWRVALALATALGCAAFVRAAEPSADESAIRATAEAYTKAFNAGDAKALANLWTADGDMVDELGRKFHGREVIEKEMTALFADSAGAKIEITIDAIKFISPDVALETGTTRGTAANRPAGPAINYNAVHVKRDGKWQLSSVSESRPAASSSADHLAPLAWLVGNWKGDLGQGQTYQLTCQWADGHCFLNRTFTVKRGDDVIGSGTQVIGWDPITQQIVSWTFDSSAGFGHESWQNEGNTWTVQASSVLANGGTSLSTNVLKQIDDNTFTWQSTERSLNAQLLPDTAEVRVVREAK